MGCGFSSSFTERKQSFPSESGLAPAAGAGASAVPQARILVVEDERITAMDMQDRLSKLGYEVVAACSTGEEAIQRATELCPDLVLMDIKLRQAMDGVQAARRIRASLDVPVVYMTASADAATIERAMCAEPFGYLVKPVDERELHTTIVTALCRHRMEREARESRQWLATIVNSIGEGVIATGSDGQVVLMNPVAEQLTGWTQEQAVGKPAADVFSVVRIHSRSKAENPIERTLKTGQAVFLREDHLLVTRNGKQIPVDASAAPIRESAGNAAGAVLVFRDITERQQVEHLLRQHTGELALLNQAGKAFNSSLDLDTVLATILDEVCDILDVTAASIWLNKPETEDMTCRQAVGRHNDIIRHWALAPDGSNGWWLLGGESQIVADTWSDQRCNWGKEPDEQPTLRSLLSVPLRSRGAVIGVLQVAAAEADHFGPTDQALLESLTAAAAIAIDNAQLVEKLRQGRSELAARNEELDAFAHTVAHDLKSPLGVIMGFSTVLERVIGQPNREGMSDAEFSRVLRRIAQTTQKMNNIIEELLLLSALRHPDVFIGPVNSAEVAAAAQQRLALMIEEAQAEITSAESWPLALGYAPWLEEVWVNYLSNAIKYGGRPPRVELGASELADGSVRFWIRDNGPGIPPEVQARLFTPHTRLEETRATGHGLGLSIVRRIVEKLGGTVQVDSKPGQGSVFSFTLRGVPHPDV